LDHTRQQERSRVTTPAPNIAEQRRKMIKLLEDALMLADDLGTATRAI
jgi:hypothetical protein